MLFSSFQFLFLFLPIVYGVFLVINHFEKLKLVSLKLISFWLAASSIAFYLFWEPKDLLPLVFSIIINYGFYRRIIFKNRNISLLIVAIAFNLLFLGYYKYISFIINEFTQFFSNVSVSVASGKGLYIPLGISFYTFTQIAFLIDCYKKQYEKNDFLNYFLFVSYFPHLVCGPILSFKELYPQLINREKFKASFQNTSLFVFCFSIGLFKKTVIGDSLGIFANQFFEDYPNSLFDMKTAWLGTLCYALQLYFDFSGYSDMAVGISYLFGLKIPDNFNAPYQSTSVIDFWRRWHISLSNFLKNYVYIPLGGNRCSALMVYRNLWITMLLGGLWHGASYTFIVWGFYQGALLSLNHFIRNMSFSRLNNIVSIIKISRFIGFINFTKILSTFLLIALGWVLFRSATLHQAANIYQSLFGFSDSHAISLHFNQWSILILGLTIAFCVPDTVKLREKFVQLMEGEQSKSLTIKSAIACGCIAVIGVLRFSRVQYFLYSGF